MEVVIVEGEGTVLGGNEGRPIVTNGDFVAYSCAEVREPIELSFGLVSGVGLGICVVDGVHVPQREGRFREIFAALV